MSGFEDIQNDDCSAFGCLYNAYKEKVFGYFLKKTGCRSDAEDLMQNTFLNIWRYRHSLSPEHPVEQQIFFIARNVFIDYTRRKNKILKISQAVEKTSGTCLPTPESVLEVKQLESLLVELPEARRKAFVLHKMEGYSYREVADQLSLSQKTIDNHIYRALKFLRKRMGTLFSFF